CRVTGKGTRNAVVWRSLGAIRVAVYELEQPPALPRPPRTLSPIPLVTVKRIVGKVFARRGIARE
ncbi:MAG: hypothetical protein ONB15_09250, partial [candidate division KSB1 bacterium]|nr:hypothetical protein [candidate division KSB1 bacterium]